MSVYREAELVVVCKIVPGLVGAVRAGIPYGVAVEDVAPVGEGVAAVAAAVGPIREQEGSGVDVVLLGGVVDGMGPSVAAEEFEPFGVTFGDGEVEAVLTGLADGFAADDIA